MPAAKASPFDPDWDYLVVTASNARQADAYGKLIEARASLGLIRGVGRVLVVPDPGGRRAGSGGSTVQCLRRVLELETGGRPRTAARRGAKAWAGIFGRLRVLIIHAGGDSKRLPPYGPCGKLFVPVPGDQGGALGTTLFDRLAPVYLRLPRPAGGGGQVVVASGDVLLDIDAESVEFRGEGVTGVGALVRPGRARHHGVYSRGPNGQVRLFLQKPSPEEQAARGAIDKGGRSVLDIGILNLGPDAAVRLLEISGTGPVAAAVKGPGLDIYSEICCALGRDSRPDDYIGLVRAAGSAVDENALRALHRGLRGLPFHVHVASRFRFLHFGTLPDLLASGRTLAAAGDGRAAAKPGAAIIDSRLDARGVVRGRGSWIEGCRIEAPLTLPGRNVLAGLDIRSPLALPQSGSIDVLEGTGRDGRRGWFVRVYSSDDVFHLPADRGGRLGGRPLRRWLSAMGAGPEDVWPAGAAADRQTAWNGRFFPIVRANAEHRDWLWLSDPDQASPADKARWRAADRYSFEEMAERADLDAFRARRRTLRGDMLFSGLAEGAALPDELSAGEIADLIRDAPPDRRVPWISALVRAAARSAASPPRAAVRLDALGASRLLHTAGSVLRDALTGQAGRRGGPPGARPGEREIVRALAAGLSADDRAALPDLGAPFDAATRLSVWAGALRAAAFRHLGRTIVGQAGSHAGRRPAAPRSVLRPDEIVWGRAPARLDLGGGWTDTPPYSLERGGRVINAAVDLNGQPPIQAFARVIGRPEIRINSIDQSARLVVRTVDELLDYRDPGSPFALAKAALALSGFAPRQASDGPARGRTLQSALQHFGGGIELTTLAAIPSGSGLGTSSIMGAVLMSVLGRMTGRPLAGRDLVHAVLRLEQAMTTGGGWQDQIGGVVEGVKMIETAPGLVPNPCVRSVPADLLNPAANGGRTLLYYTGMRRLAKNILQDVVGRYLDRDRGAMDTLGRLHAFPPLMAEAMGMRDMARFGGLLDLAWGLNVDLDPDHSTPVIEALRERIKPYALGSKLLGAGGGGFLLIACPTAADAAAVRRMLDADPPNDKARFFEFSINRTGLVVTVC